MAICAHPRIVSGRDGLHKHLVHKTITPVNFSFFSFFSSSFANRPLYSTTLPCPPHQPRSVLSVEITHKRLRVRRSKQGEFEPLVVPPLVFAVPEVNA